MAPREQKCLGLGAVSWPVYSVFPMHQCRFFQRIDRYENETHHRIPSWGFERRSSGLDRPYHHSVNLRLTMIDDVLLKNIQ